jgi:hypothetical protein
MASIARRVARRALPRRDTLRWLPGSAFLMGCAIALGGCSVLHHGPSPQQQYIEAIQRGNAAQASQIWLHMSQEDRNKFARGEGIKPSVTPQQVQSGIAEHYTDQTEGAGDSAPKQMELTPSTGGGLQELPRILEGYGGGADQPQPATGEP